MISLDSVLPNDKEVVSSRVTLGNTLLQEFFRIPGVPPFLLPELRLVALTSNQVLYEQGDKIEFVYFPLDSVVSALAIMEDGTTLETSMVGRESLVGITSILGSGLSKQWIWVLIGGDAIQLDAKVLDRVLVHNVDALKSFLKAYRALITQISQRCVCNTRHTILERLCCWLLMLHDRVGETNLNLTQEMIASRVGARRAGITVAAGMLQDMHAIEYRRGHLHVRDREVLEHAVCECYALMGGELSR